MSSTMLLRRSPVLAVRIVSDRRVRSGCSRPVVPFDGLPLPDAVGGLELLCPPLVLSEDVLVAGGLCDGAPPPALRTEAQALFQIHSTEIKPALPVTTN